MARQLQAELVPQSLPAIPGFELGAFNRVANTVGGDLYEFHPLENGGLAVLFGDASGHGMAAGLVISFLIAWLAVYCVRSWRRREWPFGLPDGSPS